MSRMSLWGHAEVPQDLRPLLLGMILPVIIFMSQPITYFLKISYLTGEILVDNTITACYFITKILRSISIAVQIVYEDALVFIVDASDKIIDIASLLKDFYTFTQSFLMSVLTAVNEFITFLLEIYNFIFIVANQVCEVVITIKHLLHCTGLHIWSAVIAVPLVFIDGFRGIINFFLGFKNYLVTIPSKVFCYTFQKILKFHKAFSSHDIESICGLLIGTIFVLLVCKNFRKLCAILHSLSYKVSSYMKSVVQSVYTGILLYARKPQAIESVNSTPIDDERLCVVCQNNPKEIIVFPCKHLCMCGECSNVLVFSHPNCPICRTHINELLKVYW